MGNRKKWMTDDQWECACLFADVVGGFHHISSEIREHGKGILIADYAHRWATFDADLLTRIVIFAHDRCIRVSLRQSGPRRVGFILFKRVREGSMFERHPTMQQAYEIYGKESTLTPPTHGDKNG